MNYRDINSASQTLRRNVQDINLEPNNRKALESVMVALAAAGRVQEIALVAQTLEKIDTKANLAVALEDIGQVIRELRDSQTRPEPAGPNEHITPSEFKQVMARLAVLETK